MSTPQKKDIKVARIIARLNVGGPARHVVWLTKALQDKEFRTALLTGTVPEGEEDMSWFAAENGVEPLYIPEMSRELSAKDAISLWKIYQELRRQEPDIIHTHTAKAGTVGRLAGFLYRWLTWKTLIGKPRPVKFIHTYHGHVFHSYYGKRKTQFFLLIEKTLARLATNKIIVISNQQHQEIHHQFKVGQAGQFQVIPLGIDLGKFEKAEEKQYLLRAEIGARPNDILIGLVGRLTEIKNISMLLKVVKIYHEQSGSEVPPLRFLIIGDGYQRQQLETEAAELGVENLVMFLGNRNDTDVFYAGLDLIALTSDNEGTPLSLIEAMANARPVISTAVGGVVDLLGQVIEEKANFTICERGVRVAPNDAQGFYEGLIYLAKDEKLRVELARNGKDFVISNYSKERLIAEIKSLYSDLLGEKG